MATTYDCSTNSVWADWATSTTTYYTISAGTVWTDWVSTGTTTSSTASGDTVVWKYWSSAEKHDYAYSTWTDQIEAIKETREQRRAREAQAQIEEQERADKARAVEEARKQAELTAQKLLEDLITEEEMEVYLKTGKLLVKGRKHDYILSKGFQADVVKIEKGKVVDLKSYRKKVKGTSYCVHPVDQHKLPETDKVIAMKIALESEEESIMNRANARGERELDLAMGM
jgi:hypothetical protein